MAKKPATPSDPTAKPRRGRPPKPGGRTPQVEVQRAYRARLAADGKVVRTVDAGAVSPTPAGVAQLSIPEFDPAKDGVQIQARILRSKNCRSIGLRAIPRAAWK